MTPDGHCEVCGFVEEDRSLHIHQLHERLKVLGRIHGLATVIYLRHHNGFTTAEHIEKLGDLLDEAKPRLIILPPR